jgi:hypothetical protein
MKNLIRYSILSVAMTSCAPKVLILQSPVASMTKNNAGNVADLKEGKAVEEKWCSNEDPVKPNDDGSKHYGMIDQVLYRAHKNTKADFFVNNRFYQQGTCVYMSATVGSSGGAGDDAPAVEAAPAPGEIKTKVRKKKKKAE